MLRVISAVAAVYDQEDRRNEVLQLKLGDAEDDLHRKVCFELLMLRAQCAQSIGSHLGDDPCQDRGRWLISSGFMNHLQIIRKYRHFT